MTANEKLRSRGFRRAQRIRLELGRELLDGRMQSGFSQDKLGAAVGMSGDKVGRIERAELATLSITDAAQLGSLLGLDLAARFYPSGARIRDAAQASRLARFVSNVGAPLRYRTDVPLPQREGAPADLRGWDCVIWDKTERTAAELESRLTDFQAMTRRHALKRRDDPVDSFLLLIADTEHNRRVMAEYEDLLPDLPRLRTANVLSALRQGMRPTSGWMFF